MYGYGYGKKVPETTVALKWLTIVSCVILMLTFLSLAAVEIFKCWGCSCPVRWSQSFYCLLWWIIYYPNNVCNCRKCCACMVGVKWVNFHCFHTVKWMFFKYIFRHWKVISLVFLSQFIWSCGSTDNKVFVHKTVWRINTADKHISHCFTDPLLQV